MGPTDRHSQKRRTQPSLAAFAALCVGVMALAAVVFFALRPSAGDTIAFAIASAVCIVSSTVIAFISFRDPAARRALSQDVPISATPFVALERNTRDSQTHRSGEPSTGYGSPITRLVVSGTKHPQTEPQAYEDDVAPTEYAIETPELTDDPELQEVTNEAIPKAPNLARVAVLPPEVISQEDLITAFAENDPFHELQARQIHLWHLVAHARDRLAKCQRILNKRLHKNTSDQLNGLLLVRRLVLGLEQRLSAIEDFIARPEDMPFDAKEAFYLVHGDLEIPNDPMNSLAVGGTSIPPIGPDDWESTLVVLLKQIASQKSFYKELQALVVQNLPE